VRLKGLAKSALALEISEGVNLLINFFLLVDCGISAKTRNKNSSPESPTFNPFKKEQSKIIATPVQLHLFAEHGAAPEVRENLTSADEKSASSKIVSKILQSIKDRILQLDKLQEYNSHE
jgi:hypothetical protein